MEPLTQLEWLMFHLEPHEALELRAACDYILSQPEDMSATCPICWLKEPIAADASISEILRSGFIWHTSPQGKPYWQAVHAKYLALESHKGEAT
jgi:hypothetical protein